MRNPLGSFKTLACCNVAIFLLSEVRHLAGCTCHVDSREFLKVNRLLQTSALKGRWFFFNQSRQATIATPAVCCMHASVSGVASFCFVTAEGGVAVAAEDPTSSNISLMICWLRAMFLNLHIVYGEGETKGKHDKSTCRCSS